MFNPKFYQPKMNYSREMAENRLFSLGYKNFRFKSCSFSHGASFYFESENGEEIRVSDHPLTGRRAFNTIQIYIVEPKIMSVKKLHFN